MTALPAASCSQLQLHESSTCQPGLPSHSQLQSSEDITWQLRRGHNSASRLKKKKLSTSVSDTPHTHANEQEPAI